MFKVGENVDYIKIMEKRQKYRIYILEKRQKLCIFVMEKWKIKRLHYVEEKNRHISD